MPAEMDEQFIINQLEELVGKFGIKVQYESMTLDQESLRGLGGLCRLRGEYVLIINAEATKEDKVKALIGAVRQFNLDQVYIRPAVRELLEKAPEPNPFHEDSK